MAAYAIWGSDDYEDYTGDASEFLHYWVDTPFLCESLDACLTVNLGPVTSDVLVALEQRDFSQAPVKVPGVGIGWRLVDTVHLRSLYETGEALTEDESHFMPNDLLQVRERLDLVSLLEGMMSRPAALLYSTSQFKGKTGMPDGTIYGLSTIFNLNGHAVRKPAFAMILDLETYLGELLKKTYPDPWDWVKRLSEDAQVRVLGFWEVSRRNGVELNPIAATTLGQLLQAAAKSTALLRWMGYKSRSKFEEDTGCLILFRNHIMHPIRPLVLAQPDVVALHKAVQRALELIPRVFVFSEYYNELKKGSQKVEERGRDAG